MIQRFMKARCSANYRKQKRAKTRNKIYLYTLDAIKNRLNRYRKIKKASQFKTKLKERKKLSILYGNLSKKQIQIIFSKASYYQGALAENVFKLLESRLDVILFRICFFRTIYSARQSIRCNKILVNNKVINIPSYQVSAGDVISIISTEKKSIRKLIKSFLKHKINCIEKKKRKQKYFFSIFSKQNNNRKFFERKTGAKEKNPIKKNKILLQKSLKSFFFSKKKKDRYFVTPNIIQSIKKNVFNINFVKSKNLTSFSVSNLKLKKKIRSILSKEWARLPDFQKEGLQQISYFLERKKKIKLGFSFKKKKGYSYSTLSKTKAFEKLNPLVLELKLKRLFYRYRSHDEKLTGLQISPFKPMHMEVSYKLLTAIYLFAPQKIVYSSLINMDLISKSFM